jgi:cystathionine beta-lyase/cystathionine gamma-synthase
VDNTFLTAVLQQPLELGADLSVYSTTKLIDGHSVALGGAVVTRDKGLLERLAFTRKCTGGVQAPFNAWLTLQGLKTLPLRIAQQSANAETIAQWLKEQPGTIVVHYPGTDDSERAELARRQHRGAHGAVVSFELEGGEVRARRILERVRLCTLVEHVGAIQTLLTHSASMTHAGVAREDRERVGVTQGLLRISVGLEDPRDVIEDLGQAIRASELEVVSCTANV